MPRIMARASWRRGPQIAASWRLATNRSRGCRLLAVGLKPFVDQRHLRIDRRVTEPPLPGDELHELIGALDVGRAVLQCARGRSRTHQRLRGSGVFLERHEILRLGAEFNAK